MKSKFNLQVKDGFYNVVEHSGIAISFLFILLMFSFQQKLSATSPNNNGNNSVVEISMWDASEFVILFDARTYGNRTHIVFDDVAPGKHQVQIYKRVYDRTYGKHRMVLVLNQGFFVTAQQRVVYQVNRNNQLQQIRNERLPKPQHNYPGQYRPAPVRELPNQHCEIATYQSPLMSNQDFNTLVLMVEDVAFSSSQINLIKQAVGNRMVTSLQVLELMQLLSFESTKLELAKWAYNKAVDRESYFVVNQGFTFSSSISELGDFMAQN